MELFVKHHFVDGLYTKEMHVPADTFVGKHKHNYTHQSILLKGVAQVTSGEETHKYVAPAIIVITANEWHTIYAETDVVWLCQHVTDCMDPELIDNELTEET